MRYVNLGPQTLLLISKSQQHSSSQWVFMEWHATQRLSTNIALWTAASQSLSCHMWTVNKNVAQKYVLFLLIFYNHKWLVTIWMWTTPFHRPGFCLWKGGVQVEHTAPLSASWLQIKSGTRCSRLLPPCLFGCCRLPSSLSKNKSWFDFIWHLL